LAIFSSIPSNRLSSLQSHWEYFASNATWSYTRLTGISCPSAPTGPTSAIWFGSALAYRVFTTAQASLAPCQQADIFHNHKRHRAPLSISISSLMPPGREADGHKAWAIPCITCRARSCSCEISCSISPADPGISSPGRPVSIPTDITLLIRFLAELFYSSLEVLTINAASKPPVLLHRVSKLSPNICQFDAQSDIGILEIIFLLNNLRQHALTLLQLTSQMWLTIFRDLRILPGIACRIFC